jgi:2,3,4,5-tetrahydropyridine-2-carboxylate N-succinyltransferase
VTGSRAAHRGDRCGSDGFSAAEALRLRELKAGLNDGSIRAAEKEGDRWVVRPWSWGILLVPDWRAVPRPAETGFRFFDKDTFPVKDLGLDSKVRVAPAARPSATAAAPGVTVMPPAYINVGAYVDAGTLVDSHALVGSCAQVGKRVHLRRGADRRRARAGGGLLVIVEDDVLIGGNCGITKAPSCASAPCSPPASS